MAKLGGSDDSTLHNSSSWTVIRLALCASMMAQTSCMGQKFLDVLVIVDDKPTKTPRTMVGPGFRDRMLAAKAEKLPENHFLL